MEGAFRLYYLENCAILQIIIIINNNNNNNNDDDDDDDSVQMDKLEELVWSSACDYSEVVEVCFASTETVGLLGTEAQDGHLDFHAALEL